MGFWDCWFSNGFGGSFNDVLLLCSMALYYVLMCLVLSYHL